MNKEKALGGVLTLLLISALGAGCATMTSDTRLIWEPRVDPAQRAGITVSVENKPQPEDDTADEIDAETEFQSGIRIESLPPKAQVYLNSRYRGVTPLTIKDPPEGTYLLEIEKDSFYSLDHWITYQDESWMEITATLQPITGFIDITAPEDSRITLSGETAAAGITEVVIGSYLIKVEKFGYDPFETAVVIHENETVRVTADLKEAELQVSGFRTDRPVWNPANPGLLGKARFRFRVNTYGTGSLQCYDKEGRTIWKTQLPRFNDWEQLVLWDGKLADGSRIPDGVYDLRLTAVDEAGKSEQLRSLSFRIDSTATYTLNGLWSSASGLLLCPDAGILPPGGLQVNLTASPTLPSGPSLIPVHASLRFAPLPWLEAGITGNLLLGEETSRWGSFSLKTPLTPRSSLPFRAAFAAAGHLGDNRLLTEIGSASGVSLALPFEVGGKRFGLAAAPGFSWHGAFRLSGSAGLYLRLDNLNAGLSARFSSLDLAEGFTVRPEWSSAGEIQLLIPETYLALTLFTLLEWNALTPGNWFLGGGFSYIM